MENVEQASGVHPECAACLESKRYIRGAILTDQVIIVLPIACDIQVGLTIII